MKKVFAIIICLLLVGLIVFFVYGEQEPARQQSVENAESAGMTKSIVDMAGRTVTIPQNIESFGYCYFGSTLDFVALGVGHKITVKPATLSADAPLLRELERWGYPELLNAAPALLSQTVNSEELLKAKPQVVFLDKDNIKGIRQVEALGIPVVGVKFPGGDSGIAGCVQYMCWLGDIFGGTAPQKAAAYKTFVDNSLKTLQTGTASVPKDRTPKVLAISYWSGAYFGVFGTMMTESITAAGGDNVLAGQGNQPINREQILAWNPDVILLQTENQANFDKFLNADGIKDLTAVKNGKVYQFWYSHGGSIETILLADYIATKLYPDRFSPEFLRDQISLFHQIMYGITLPDEAADLYYTWYSFSH